ncbi:MAG: hypothetical protein H6718_23470 [Polyangiaceae bacterium]|nr:hypothetical protein [Polyangiaceae bacterium]
MNSDEDLQQLAALARATDSLAPSAGFEARVMARIRERVERESWKSRGVLLGCFAAAAAIAIWVAQIEQRQVDTTALTLIDSLELSQ